MPSGCHGGCCTSFPVADEPFDTHQEIIDALWEGALSDDPHPDDAFLAEMLIPAGFEAGEPRFTCRWWDADTRLCTVWDRRPDMCRGYPNYPGHACAFCDGACDHGCGYKVPLDETWEVNRPCPDPERHAKPSGWRRPNPVPKDFVRTGAEPYGGLWTRWEVRGARI